MLPSGYSNSVFLFCFRQVGEEFSKDIAKLTTEKISTSVAKDKGFELCTQLSTDLDNLNTKLHTFLARLQDSLYNFQHVSLLYKM